MHGLGVDGADARWLSNKSVGAPFALTKIVVQYSREIMLGKNRSLESQPDVYYPATAFGFPPPCGLAV